jgi:hypothetical protein
MNKLSTDIVGIIKKYLLPLKEIVRINKKKCLRDIIKSTFWIEKDLLDISKGLYKRMNISNNSFKYKRFENFYWTLTTDRYY